MSSSLKTVLTKPDPFLIANLPLLLPLLVTIPALSCPLKYRKVGHHCNSKLLRCLFGLLILILKCKIILFKPSQP